MDGDEEIDGGGQSVTHKIACPEDMSVYQLFYQLALRVEEAIRGVPPDFRWWRTQALRSSESVCANLTEGFYSQYRTEDLQSPYRSRRQARETMAHIRHGRDIGLISPETAGPVLQEYEDACQQLKKLIGSIERKIQRYGKAKSSISMAREGSGDYEIEPVVAADVEPPRP